MPSNLPDDVLAARVLNAAGTLTRLAGARVHPSVAKAMAEAAGHSFDMWRLQAAASLRLAAATGAEAGIVTTGAAAGLTLAAAAVIAGLDAVRMDRLPLTGGLANEIVVPRLHRNAYDRALRAGGARLVEIGIADRETTAGIRGLEAWEVEAALGPGTVAMAASAAPSAERDIPVLAEVARRRGLPLIVDAAAQLPPAANLRHYFGQGASLVVFSGGKAIGGPQASGILAGRRDLIASAALQMLDMDVRPEAFEAPPAFFPDGAPAALPRHGIGRGFKASKEAIAGLLVALDAFVARDWAKAERGARRRLARYGRDLRNIAGLSTAIIAGRRDGALPRLALVITPSISGYTAATLAERLRWATPPVHLGEGNIADDELILDLAAVRPEDDAGLIAALRKAAMAG